MVKTSPNTSATAMNNTEETAASRKPTACGRRAASPKVHGEHSHDQTNRDRPSQDADLEHAGLF